MKRGANTTLSNVSEKKSKEGDGDYTIQSILASLSDPKGEVFTESPTFPATAPFTFDATTEDKGEEDVDAILREYGLTTGGEGGEDEEEEEEFNGTSLADLMAMEEEEEEQEQEEEPVPLAQAEEVEAAASPLECDCADLTFDEEKNVAVCSVCKEQPFELNFLKAPPKDTVYKRCLTPSPTFQITVKNNKTAYPFDHFVIEASLITAQTHTVSPHLSGMKEMSCDYRSENDSYKITFKKLKITQTSKQNKGFHFRLQFTLYAECGNERMPLCAILSHTINVVSHKDLLVNTAGVSRINRIIPNMLSEDGGELAIFGADFADTKFLKVRIGDTVLSKVPRRSASDAVGVIFHSPGVLIVNVPRNVIGNPGKALDVYVSNDNGKKWSRQSKYARITVAKPTVVVGGAMRDPAKLIENLTEMVNEHFRAPSPPGKVQISFGKK